MKSPAKTRILCLILKMIFLLPFTSRHIFASHHQDFSHIPGMKEQIAEQTRLNSMRKYLGNLGYYQQEVSSKANFCGGRSLFKVLLETYKGNPDDLYNQFASLYEIARLTDRADLKAASHFFMDHKFLLDLLEEGNEEDWYGEFDVDVEGNFRIIMQHIIDMSLPDTDRLKKKFKSDIVGRKLLDSQILEIVAKWFGFTFFYTTPRVGKSVFASDRPELQASALDTQSRLYFPVLIVHLGRHFEIWRLY